MQPVELDSFFASYRRSDLSFLSFIYSYAIDTARISCVPMFLFLLLKDFSRENRLVRSTFDPEDCVRATSSKQSFERSKGANLFGKSGTDYLTAWSGIPSECVGSLLPFSNTVEHDELIRGIVRNEVAYRLVVETYCLSSCQDSMWTTSWLNREQMRPVERRGQQRNAQIDRESVCSIVYFYRFELHTHTHTHWLTDER